MATLQTELLYRNSWPTRQTARTAIFEYIEGVYNSGRRNSALEFLRCCWAVRHHRRMKAYSEDLRRKIVEVAERRMSTSEAARTFGVGISSVKRYAAAYPRGPIAGPEEAPRFPRPKLDERSSKLLEADLEVRPAATLPQRREFLEGVAGVQVSESTIMEPKKDR